MKQTHSVKEFKEIFQQSAMYSPRQLCARQKLPPILSENVKQKIVKALKQGVNIQQQNDMFIKNYLPQGIIHTTRSKFFRTSNGQHQIPTFDFPSQKKLVSSKTVSKIKKMRIAYQPEKKIAQQLEQLSDRNHYFKPFFSKGER